MLPVVSVNNPKSHFIFTCVVFYILMTVVWLIPND